jgi:hypothetical protein
MFALAEAYNGENWPVLIAALLGGMIADVLYVWLRPSTERVGPLRLFGFLVPFALFLFVVAALLLTDGLWWRVHMWLGMPFLTGVLGFGLSYLMAPTPPAD